MKNFLVLMKTPALLFLILLIISCGKKENTVKTNENKAAMAPEKKKPAELDSAQIFGVYRITDKDFAIVRAVQYDNPEMPLSKDYGKFLEKDSIPWIYRKPMRDYQYVDSVRYYGLIRNQRFTKEFLSKMKPEYFVYGTKGGAKCRIKDVVFKSTDCGNDFIAYIIEADTDKIGMPLIASETEIPLDYIGDFKGFTKNIREFTKKDATETNYGNGENYQPKVFARYGAYYFTYHDDFEGYDQKSEKAGIQFPERLIVTKNLDGRFKIYWIDEMDLLGLPCL